MGKTKPALLLAACLLTSGCAGTCRNTPVARSVAPDGQHSAVLFNRDCGTTTGFSTQISLIEAGTAPIGQGNVFRADDDHGQANAGSWGGPWAAMRWIAPDHLLVTYARHARVFARESRVSGVTVTYEAVDH